MVPATPLIYRMDFIVQIHEFKYEFNVRLLALRDRKLNIIEEIHDIVNQLSKVHSKLDPSKHKPLPKIPEMQLDEMPEK